MSFDDGDLQVVIKEKLEADTKAAIMENFPDQQLPDWERFSLLLKQGWSTIHELRCKSTGRLISVRALTRFPSLFRGDPPFMLISLAVTPDDQSGCFGKSKGYGGYLFRRSQEICLQQMPNCLALVGECERLTASAGNAEQREQRAIWMRRLGRYSVEDLDYELPPMSRYETDGPGTTLVHDRVGEPEAGHLLITRFDGERTVDGTTLYRIVEDLYIQGYDISKCDPYLAGRLELIDQSKIYRLTDI